MSIEDTYPDPAVPMDQIARAALRVFKESWAGICAPALSGVTSLADAKDATQNAVTITLSGDDLGQSLKSLTDRFISPAAANLAGAVQRKRRFGLLEIPSGRAAARATDEHVSIRAAFAWWSAPIIDDDGETIGYEAPLPRLRFDVLTVPA